MMRSVRLSVVSLMLLMPIFVFASSQPNWKLTPGVLCTSEDPNFDKYDYPENIARCSRNVDTEEKDQVAAEYGNIPRSSWSEYEFDHLIPLCAGGSDDIKNLWPQPIDEAHDKDKLENEVCLGLRAGTLKQADAVKQIYDWFKLRATRTAVLPDLF